MGFEPGIICSAGRRDDHYPTRKGIGVIVYLWQFFEN
jgi:hypothetical protein